MSFPCYRATFLLKATGGKINDCKHGLVDGAVRARERERVMVSRYILIRDWVLLLVVQLCLVRCSADYFWDGTGWKWQESPGGGDGGLGRREGAGAARGRGGGGLPGLGGGHSD